MKTKTVYYENELEDEFSKAKITPKKIDGSYDYNLSSSADRFKRYILQGIAKPLSLICVKLRFSRKIVGKEKLKPYKSLGIFLYGNHTQTVFDAINPSTLVFPKTAYTVVSSENVSIKILGSITPYLGALPIPDTTGAYRNFRAAIKQKIDEGGAVIIYPEAHIWPYHTGIRSFSDTPFYYPAKLGAPAFTFTNTYQKSPIGVKITTYIDGPFFPDMTLSLRARAKCLRDKVFDTMTERAKSSTLTLIEYVKREGSL